MSVLKKKSVPNVGLILLDELLKPIHANLEAARILSYPQEPPAPEALNKLLRDRLRLMIAENHLSSGDGKVFEFKSGSRTYRCRAFTLSWNTQQSAARMIIFLERSARDALDFSAISERYNLTPREARTAQLVMHGMTSKEIAVHLNISPNTVKTFLHTTMLKMAVTTRTGIVGRILESQIEFAEPVSENERMSTG